VLGSVRSATGDVGSIEERYEYDAFGKPYKGDLSGGMNLGYTGKPYDVATGLYNYGYRDYKPQAARFTTVDPIRDGNNWFAYVNNDPVNWIDLWGLNASEQVRSYLQKTALGRDALETIDNGVIHLKSYSTYSIVYESEPKITTIHGYFDSDTNTIAVSIIYNPEDIASIIIHEYVHYTQEEKGMEKIDKEYEAHIKQAEFYLELGIPHGFNPSYIENNKINYDAIKNDVYRQYGSSRDEKGKSYIFDLKDFKL